MGVHELAALLLKVEELEIDEAEAKALAKALLNLQQCYPSIDIPAHVMAWVGMAAACGRVYAPRVGAYRLRVRNERASAPRAQKVQAVA
jgi:hypothetical protein